MWTACTPHFTSFSVWCIGAARHKHAGTSGIFTSVIVTYAIGTHLTGDTVSPYALCTCVKYGQCTYLFSKWCMATLGYRRLQYHHLRHCHLRHQHTLDAWYCVSICTVHMCEVWSVYLFQLYTMLISKFMYSSTMVIYSTRCGTAVLNRGDGGDSSETKMEWDEWELGQCSK